MSSNIIGNIDISALNTLPEKSEFEVAKIFVSIGKDVTFIPPSSIPNLRTPDILMDGVEWEIKSPTGSSKRTIENNISRASKQSKNLIIDLSHIKLNEKECIRKIEKEFNNRKSIKRIYIIKKNGEIIKLTK